MQEKEKMKEEKKEKKALKVTLGETSFIEEKETI